MEVSGHQIYMVKTMFILRSSEWRKSYWFKKTWGSKLWHLCAGLGNMHHFSI